MKRPILNIEGLNLRIDSLQLANSFSVSVAKGERIGITGPSGCGKSTLLKFIVDNDLFSASNADKVEINNDLSISYAPQSEGLLPWYSVEKNLKVFSKDSKLTSETIDLFNLNKVLQSFPNQLSGGEYQRTILATAIINKPDFFLVDEPLTELDINSKWELLHYWSKKIKESNSSLLLVSHDIETLLYMCDKIIVLSGKPFKVKRQFHVTVSHPRQLDFLVSDEFIDSKRQLLDIIQTHYFQVIKDWETSERAGAGGMFQIESLLDSYGRDMTDKVDVGIHFHDDEHLKEYLSKIFGIQPTDILIDEQ